MVTDVNQQPQHDGIVLEFGPAEGRMKIYAGNEVPEDHEPDFDKDDLPPRKKRGGAARPIITPDGWFASIYKASVHFDMKYRLIIRKLKDPNEPEWRYDDTTTV